jgi:glycosyltransferase involved in cell wall biosynthesis
MLGLDKIVNINVIASKWQGTNLAFIPHRLEQILDRVVDKIDTFYIKCFPASEFGTRIAERYIGYTMLEASRIPQSWVDNINNNCERVIVPCTHQKKAFLDSGVKRDVAVVPIGIDVSKFPEVTPPDDEEFIFGTMGTLTYRKGTDVLVKAFLKAFPKKDYPNVSIYIKTIPVGGIAHAWFIDGELIKHDDRIKLYTQSLSPKELISEFFAKINCFVFPTRGEGFGLPVAEAMCVGLPTISTNWSGTGDFVTDAVAYPLSYDIVDVPRGDWKGYPEGLQADGMQWAEPSVDHLVELMREVYENRDKAYKKGKKARKFILENYNNVTTSQMLVDYLDEKF